MTKIPGRKKLTFFLVVLMLITCAAAPAYAATVTTVEAWQPATTQNPTAPYTVYMYSANDVEKFAWKTLSRIENPYFDDFEDYVWSAERYVNNDDSMPLMYSYTFDGSAIDQDLVPTMATKQPYYLNIAASGDSSETEVVMGCRTMFPVPMTVKVPTDIYDDTDVTVEYEDGSCNGYYTCGAGSYNQLFGSGDPDYLDDYSSYVFSDYDTTVEDGYVTFTTWHGGDYTIIEQ
ncbi:hypothetical protein [Desulfoscipio sp. XC116]|uniref:hypothetical protein n=1 Tax=Desulfoscipio sp. XC116 TaxID=3144975 RepID=UPI00325AA98E